MPNLTLKLTTSQFAKLKQHYQKKLQTNSLNSTVAFFVLEDATMITAFNNQTLLLQGNNIESKLLFLINLLDIQFSTTNTKVASNILNQQKTNLDSYYISSIGSDEVGTGDVFGPVVVCSVYLAPEKIPFFKKMGSILESKQMNDTKIMTFVPSILDHVTKSIAIIKPNEYNQNIAKQNLNKIKASLHNIAIIQTLEKINKIVPVILDQFCFPTNYFNYLKDQKEIYSNINFKTKADQNYLSVTLASIIARYVFLQEINTLNEHLSCKLRLGAGVIVDQQIAKIIKKHGTKILTQIAKCNFKNVTHKYKKYL
ncbi:ribonuclease HIII [Candidatus Phytoplasma solani]|uniref:ribonuclease HIII n=1 Tax=Candidatus Phytoplasma solani TaxID=69896 RepID=UPI00358F0284